MRLIPALIVLFCATMAASASAQGAARICSPANGQHTTIAEVSSDPKAWMGKCITVKGIYSNERIYADADAVYGVSAASIGGYVDGRGSMDGFWEGEFAGRVTDCASAQADLDTGLLRSPGISLEDRVLGCKKPQGPFLVFLVPRDLKPATITRRLPGAKGGDLVPAPKDWAGLAAVQKLATDFVAALRGGDKKALLDLVGNEYAVERLFTSDTALADLRKPADLPMQVFLDRGTTASSPAPSAVCWCRTKDCSKSWPIARRDADNQVSRPYACARISAASNGKARFDASQTFDGAPEPR